MFQGQKDDKRKRNVSYLFLQFYFLGDLNYPTPSSERETPLSITCQRVKSKKATSYFPQKKLFPFTISDFLNYNKLRQ
jgi:hypothetical protein